MSGGEYIRGEMSYTQDKYRGKVICAAILQIYTHTCTMDTFLFNLLIAT